MAILTKAPRGTQDVLPADSYRWQVVEDIIRETARLYGFKEIRFPTFEHTELYQRSVGDTTDVVQKEMYTFLDKGDRSITLRPEGTAGTVRAMIEHGLLGGVLPVKAYYLTSCFRYEKPQAGRLREFHQFGAELFGAASPTADAEMIALASEIFKMLGVTGLRLAINSIGCPTCRASYHQALTEYFSARKEELCATCRERLATNPMRILDCKSPVCSGIAAGAPVILDFLCDECKEHFEGVKARLSDLEIPYTVDPGIVRGLDYYTKTVFEFISDDIGAQGTVCGGGRYDGLVAELGGAPTPALGFGMGLERLLLLLQAQGIELPEPRPCELYLVSIGEAANRRALALTNALRKEGFYVDCDQMGRSVKAQMKYADKLGSVYTLVLGEDELQSGKAQLKQMDTGETRQVELSAAALSEVLYQAGTDRLNDALADWFPQE